MGVRRLPSLDLPAASPSGSLAESSPFGESEAPQPARRRSSSLPHQVRFGETADFKASTGSRRASPRSSRQLIWYEESHRAFHLRCGEAQYSFRVDRHGCLEHLYFGPWIGLNHDLSYLDENTPGLNFEPAPASAPYTTGLLKRLVLEHRLDVKQLWSVCTRRNVEHGGDWHMTRIENASWRLRHIWNRSGWRCAGESPEDILRILEKSNMQGGEDPRTLELLRGRQGEKGTKLLEVSEFGTGDFRNPSMELCFESDGSRLVPLVYRRHKIVEGIMPSKMGLPLLGMRDVAGAHTLVVEMVDPHTQFSVHLLYTVFPNHPAISRRMVVRNTMKLGFGAIDLMKCMSATYDFMTNDWHLVMLQGGYANERNITTRRVQMGTMQIGSRRGMSSHQSNPFLAITRGTPSEEHGWCYGLSLLYSGNWLMEVEQAETGCVRLNAGINPTQFCWKLGMQETFETPESVCVFSSQGLAAMTQAFHRLYGERLIAPQWRNLICPVLANTWEGLYFNVYHERVLEMARCAAAIGVELFVMDDGWFGRRDDDTSSLGDWSPDLRKLPHGLRGLAKEINTMGMKFGLWVEPEMVNADSDLCRAHPEWVLHHPNRLQAESRNQVVLDLTRTEVQDYIIQCLSTVLSSANIEYIKWDMNRPLTDAFSASLPASRQGEVYHRYVLGLYRICEEITSKFPQVLMEGCAGGGGRFDPGMMAWFPQIWTSDNTDAFSRARIQFGTSMWAPLRTLGAHVTACPNHQTHRTVMLKTRCIMSLFGTFGLELDIAKMPPHEVEQLKACIALRKELCPVVLHGDYYRLPGFGYAGAAFNSSAGLSDRGDSNVYAWMCVDQDALRAVVGALVIHHDPIGQYPSRLRLKGLRGNTLYEVLEHLPMPQKFDFGYPGDEESKKGPQYKLKRKLKLPGSVLMNIGLPVHFEFDGDAVLFELKAVVEDRPFSPRPRPCMLDTAPDGCGSTVGGVRAPRCHGLLVSPLAPPVAGLGPF